MHHHASTSTRRLGSLFGPHPSTPRALRRMIVHVKPQARKDHEREECQGKGGGLSAVLLSFSLALANSRAGARLLSFHNGVKFACSTDQAICHPLGCASNKRFCNQQCCAARKPFFFFSAKNSEHVLFFRDCSFSQPPLLHYSFLLAHTPRPYTSFWNYCVRLAPALVPQSLSYLPTYLPTFLVIVIASSRLLVSPCCRAWFRCVAAKCLACMPCVCH